MNKALKAYLDANEMSQRAFADAVGVREATVTAWKQGVIPRPPQLAKIQEVTGGAVPVSSWFPAAESAQ